MAPQFVKQNLLPAKQAFFYISVSFQINQKITASQIEAYGYALHPKAVITQRSLNRIIVSHSLSKDNQRKKRPENFPRKLSGLLFLYRYVIKRGA